MFALIGYLVYSGAVDAGTAVVIGLTNAAVILAAIVVHEWAHGWTGQLLGMTVARVELTASGGRTTFTGTYRRPIDGAIVAAAGPLSTAVLAALAWVVGLQQPGGLTRARLLSLAIMLLLLTLSNAVPAWGLDGGLVLAAFIRQGGGSESSVVTAVMWAGRAVIAGSALVALAVASVLPDGGEVSVLILWLIGVSFLLPRDKAARQALAVHRALEQGAWLHLGTPAWPVPAHVPVSGIALDRAWVVTDGASIVGVVDPQAVMSVPEELRGTMTVAAVTTAVPPDAVVTVTRGTSQLDLARALAVACCTYPWAVVRHESGAQPRIVTRAEVEATLQGRPAGTTGGRAA